MNDWDADVTYSEKIVKEIVAHSTSLKVTDVKFLDEGFDNSVYLVNNSYAFRFVRREEGLNFIQNELLALPLLQHIQPNLPLKTPVPKYQGHYHNKWKWVGYQYFTGHPFYELGLEDKKRNQSAKKLAQFLRSLHEQSIQSFSSAGIPGDVVGHFDLDRRVPYCQGKLELLLKKRLIPARAAYQELIDEVLARGVGTFKSLVHGDLNAAHVLFENKLPAAVIDWGDIHIGHPATDLAFAFTFFPPEGRKEFQENYGNESDHLWLLAKFRALFHTLTILEYTHETRQKVLFNEASKALAWTFASAA
jgi:aminoglycoside phosphotransferase (APT) family kinase protein